MLAPILTFYDLAWRLAMPFLRRSPRLGRGWQERTLQQVTPGPFDLWIQAASGGESLLTNMLLTRLAALLPQGKTLTVLATSGTLQGIEILQKGCADLLNSSTISVTAAFFPLDAPHLMARAFDLYTPKLAIIVETELWPGFLVSARKKNIPVFLINGRMSEKSFKTYRHFRSFFQKYGPDKILAISPSDAERFAGITDAGRVELMQNIKFDRIEIETSTHQNPALSALLPTNAPFIVFGSIRREEEELITRTIVSLLQRHPDAVIGLFPKHLERADNWLARLQERGLKVIIRSQAATVAAPGSVIVWDLFGELFEAYGLAATAFIGGSLVDLGGQNFIEPLVFGVQPIIGPYWQDFAWVGRDIVSSGLVREISDEKELTDALIEAVNQRYNKALFLQQVENFFRPHKGGTEQMCHVIIEQLSPNKTI